MDTIGHMSTTICNIVSGERASQAPYQVHRGLSSAYLQVFGNFPCLIDSTI